MAEILVIDDSHIFRTWLRTALEQAGHEVREAAGGMEGIRSYLRQTADLVLCDLFMPEMDGLETIRQMRREFPDARIVAMSGDAPVGSCLFLRIAEKLGATGTVRKSSDPTMLLATVDELLDDVGADRSVCLQLQ
jgi:two-component system chemotaxis response regulator CheY